MSLTQPGHSYLSKPAEGHANEPDTASAQLPLKAGKRPRRQGHRSPTTQDSAHRACPSQYIVQNIIVHTAHESCKQAPVGQ